MNGRHDFFGSVLTGRRGVIFDWDGTLVDNHLRNYQALCAALAPHRVTVGPQWYRQHCGLPIYELLRRIPGARHLPLEQIVTASRSGLLASTSPATLVANTTVLDLAEYANTRGLPCAIATGSAAVLVTAGLDALGRPNMFRPIVTREDVEHGKPAPDTYLEAARRLHLDPAVCLAVEDAPDGIESAHRAGMPVLVVRGNELTDVVYPRHGA